MIAERVAADLLKEPRVAREGTLMMIDTRSMVRSARKTVQRPRGMQAMSEQIYEQVRAAILELEDRAVRQKS